MSQLLNISNQYYDEGCALLKSGDKKGAEDAFKSALASIRKVQYVYPLNQQAAILTLKINRELDPQKFNEEFSQKIEAARLMCQKADTRQEGYANLLDYYELEPNYRGLKDLIYQVEIEIGIRQKPVTKTGENSAKKLITQAQTAYNKAGNDTASLKKALALVDEALGMLPNDKTAIALKDTITTKIGGNTLPVLSTDEERLYQLAVQRLQSNNVVGARALVNQILKKPQNENIQKIKDLIVKIEARS
jgi:TolA-binding protein